MRVIFILISLLICAARANDDAPIYNPYPPDPGGNGFYLGAMAGVEGLDTRVRGYDLRIEGVGITGSLYGGYLGYQYPLYNGISISLEGEYNLHNTGLRFISINQRPRYLELRKSFGGTFRMSFPVYEYVDFYAYAGMTRLRFSATQKITASSTKGETNDGVGGKMGGFGLELMNDTPMRLRLEYRFILYDEFKLFRINNVKQKKGSNPRSSTFALGAQYNF